MARFDRKVNRKKDSFQFTKKKENNLPRRRVTSQDILNFSWITKNKKNIFYLIISFFVVGFIFVPLLSKLLPYKLAYILANIFITPGLVIFTTSFVNKENIDNKAYIYRYGYLAILFGIISILASGFI